MSGLANNLLEEQSDLSAVGRFARWHASHTQPALQGLYRRLLPLTRPQPGEQYAFEVDLDRCSGCKACVSACHSLNGLDEGEAWRQTGLLVGQDWRQPYQQTVTTACHHCVDPACLNGCPVLAYDKDVTTGIVRHLDDQCIGCQYCVLKCPYEVPQYSPSRGIVRKCDMCHQRLEVGEAPACVQACPNEAIRITVVDQLAVAEQYRARGTRSAPPATLTHSPVQPANPFLPSSPAPDYTLPTTQFRSAKLIPGSARAADYEELRLQPAHSPLVLMLVCSQLSVGLFLFDLLLRLIPRPLPTGGFERAQALAGFVAALGSLAVGVLHLGRPRGAWRAFLGLRQSWLSREMVALGLFITVAGIYTVVCALAPAFAPGAPRFGVPALAGLVAHQSERAGTSPATPAKAGTPNLRRLMTLLLPKGEGRGEGEGIARKPDAPRLGVPASAGLVAHQSERHGISPAAPAEAGTPNLGRPMTLLSCVTVLLGLTVVFCSAMVYHDTRREFWHWHFSAGKFLGTTLVLGAAGTLVNLASSNASVPPAAWSALLVATVMGGLLKLSLERRVLARLADDDYSTLHKSALLLTTRLGLAYRSQIACTVLGVLVLPALLAVLLGRASLTPSQIWRVIPWLAFVLALAGELLERRLFFLAVQPVKMPGGSGR